MSITKSLQKNSENLNDHTWISTAGRKTKSIRIPIKIPKSLSEHIRTSKEISPADFEKIKRLAPSLKDLSRITNCSLHLSGSGNRSRQQLNTVEPEEIDLTEVDGNHSDTAQTGMLMTTFVLLKCVCAAWFSLFFYYWICCRIEKRNGTTKYR